MLDDEDWEDYLTRHLEGGRMGIDDGQVCERCDTSGMALNPKGVCVDTKDCVERMWTKFKDEGGIEGDIDQDPVACMLCGSTTDVLSDKQPKCLNFTACDKRVEANHDTTKVTRPLLFSEDGKPICGDCGYVDETPWTMMTGNSKYLSKAFVSKKDGKCYNASECNVRMSRGLVEGNVPFCIHCHNVVKGELCTVENMSSKIITDKSIKDAHVECISVAECKKKKPRDTVVKYNPQLWNGQSGYVTNPKCRHSPTSAFVIEELGLTFFGASESKLDQGGYLDSKIDYAVYSKENLTVSLLGSDSRDSRLFCDSNFHSVLDRYTRRPQLAIKWADMQAPKLDPGFWTELAALAKAEGYKNVIFYCIGGHGRTGTALSSILIEVCGYKPSDAVKFLRKNYCDCAVETESQVDYLVSLYEYHNGPLVVEGTNKKSKKKEK